MSMTTVLILLAFGLFALFWRTGRQGAVFRTLAILGDIATQGVYDLATLSVALRELRTLG